MLKEICLTIQFVKNNGELDHDKPEKDVAGVINGDIIYARDFKAGEGDFTYYRLPTESVTPSVSHTFLSNKGSICEYSLVHSSDPGLDDPKLQLSDGSDFPVEVKDALKMCVADIHDAEMVDIFG